MPVPTKPSESSVEILADLYFVQEEASSELSLVLIGSPIFYHMFSVLPGLKDVNKKLLVQNQKNVVGNKIALQCTDTKYLRRRQRCKKAKHWSDPPQSHNICKCFGHSFHHYHLMIISPS